VLGGAGGADDVRAAGLGNLHGQVADASGGRVDQDALAGLDPQAYRRTFRPTPADGSAQ
jgi:hypothetical protein